MIDLCLLLSNTLWIAGLSLLLATLSWAWWAAGAEGLRVGVALARPGARLAAGLGLALLCGGLAATGRGWWERALWAALAVAALVYAIAVVFILSRSHRGHGA